MFFATAYSYAFNMYKRIINNIRTNFFVAGCISLLFSFACTNPETSKKNSTPDQKKSKSPSQAYKKPSSGLSDTIIIKNNAAVFFNPDSLQLKKIKASLDTMIIESTIHDCFYQMKNAKMVLKESWPHIQVLDISKARYLLFIKKNNSQEFIDLDTQNDMCGLLLFNRIKKPQLADMMNIATELDFYFKK